VGTSYLILVVKLEAKYLGDPGAEGKIILKPMIK
jgi:hypothetical protein